MADLPGAKTILVIEDEDMVPQYIARMLEEAGYAVLQAGHGRAALDLLATGVQIDMVIADLVVPTMGRLAARRTPRPGQVVADPVITGYDRDAATVPGPLLAKPFSRTN